MFHVTWTTFKFNKNQLGTVLALAVISMPSSNHVNTEAVFIENENCFADK